MDKAILCPCQQIPRLSFPSQEMVPQVWEVLHILPGNKTPQAGLLARAVCPEPPPVSPALSMHVPNAAAVEHGVLEGDGTPSPTCEIVSSLLCGCKWVYTRA